MLTNQDVPLDLGNKLPNGGPIDVLAFNKVVVVVAGGGMGLDKCGAASVFVRSDAGLVGIARALVVFERARSVALDAVALIEESPFSVELPLQKLAFVFKSRFY